MLITVHGVIMIFFVLMPGLVGGLGNYFIVIMCLRCEIELAKLNNSSILWSFISIIIIGCALFTECSISAGWTLYSPLSTRSGILTIFVIYGLLISGISTLSGIVNYILTTISTSVSGRELVDLIVLGIVCISLMLLIVVPILTGGFILLLIDSSGYDYISNMNSIEETGDSILYEHIFWLFGHPEVYIIIIPGFVVISHILSNIYMSSIFGKEGMKLAIISIGLLGNIVWSHHLYTIGMEVDSTIYFTISTLIIGIPTGTKVYNWIEMLYNNNTNLIKIYNNNLIDNNVSESNNTDSLTVGLMIILFISGGLTGIILANNVLDIALHDTYYVIAHFHYVLSISALLGYWLGLLLIFNNKVLLIRIHRLIIIALLYTWNLTFASQYLSGLNTSPRRYSYYADNNWSYSYVSSVGSLTTLIVILLLQL